MTDCWWLPYLGQDFDARTWTCWHLVRTVLGEHFGVDVPEHAGVYPARPDRVAAEVASEKARGWITIELNNERPGDVCSFILAGVEAHVGVVIGPGYVLHVSLGQPTRVDTIAAASRITPLAGIWRHPDLAPTSPPDRST